MTSSTQNKEASGRTGKMKPKASSPSFSNKPRLVQVVDVGKAKYIAIGRLDPTIKKGDLFLIQYNPETGKGSFERYENKISPKPKPVTVTENKPE